MKVNKTLVAVNILVALGLLSSQSVLAAGSSINACVDKKTGVVRIVNKCKTTETAMTWNQTGVAGPKGETGPKGDTGNTGPQGITGPAGPQGVQGPVGLQGVQGPTGAQGFTGPQGLQGLVGPQGPQGLQGIQGPAGASGSGANVTTKTVTLYYPQVTWPTYSEMNNLSYTYQGTGVGVNGCGEGTLISATHPNGIANGVQLWRTESTGICYITIKVIE
jgi:hypothetical protein